MFKIIILATSLNFCPVIEMRNTSTDDWNKHDTKILKTAKRRCTEIYPDAPCVRLFWKKDAKQYSIICTSKIKRKKV